MNRPIKILIVHNKHLTRAIGGEDIIYTNEVEALKDVLGHDNIFQYDVCNNDIKLYSLIFNIWFSFFHYRKLKKIIKNNKIDIIHVHNFFPLLTASIFKASKISGAKVIHTLHNYRWWCISGDLYCTGKGICHECFRRKSVLPAILNKCFRTSYLQTFLVVLAFKFYKRFTKYIDKYIVLTSFQKQKVIELGLPESKVIVKSNFIKINNLNVENNRLNIKKDYLFIGYLNEAKGIRFLLENWKKLSNSYKLTIIGSGALKDYTSNFAKNSDNIEYVGRVEQEEIQPYLLNHKYLIQSSLMYETFGLTIIEAMANGVPVIGMDLGTRAELIKNEYNGFLYKSYNFIDVIEKSYNYPKYNDLARNCVEFSEKLKSESVIRTQVELYKTILESN